MTSAALGRSETQAGVAGARERSPSLRGPSHPASLRVTRRPRCDRLEWRGCGVDRSSALTPRSHKQCVHIYGGVRWRETLRTCVAAEHRRGSSSPRVRTGIRTGGALAKERERRACASRTSPPPRPPTEIDGYRRRWACRPIRLRIRQAAGRRSGGRGRARERRARALAIDPGDLRFAYRAPLASDGRGPVVFLVRLRPRAETPVFPSWHHSNSANENSNSTRHLKTPGVCLQNAKRSEDLQKGSLNGAQSPRGLQQYHLST